MMCLHAGFRVLWLHNVQALLSSSPMLHVLPHILDAE